MYLPNYFVNQIDWGYQLVLLRKYNLNIEDLTYYQVNDFLSAIAVIDNKNEEAFTKRKLYISKMRDIDDNRNN